MWFYSGRIAGEGLEALGLLLCHGVLIALLAAVWGCSISLADLSLIFTQQCHLRPWDLAHELRQSSYW
jgi:hypothetical protein